MHPARLILPLAVACLLPLSARGQTQKAELFQSSETLPVPPDYLAPLLSAGNIQFAFYDVRPATQAFTGETNFDLKVDYKFRFSVRRAPSSNTSLQQLSITLSSITTKLTNRVSLPIELVDDDFWNAQLVRHELDHVRINSDPRVALLLRRLVAGVKSMQTPRTITQQQIQAILDVRIQERIDEVSRVVRENNALLDRVTTHGLVDDRGDPHFFDRLYQKANLSETHFRFESDIGSLFRNRKYKGFTLTVPEAPK